VNTAYQLASLGAWWGEKRLSDVTPANCTSYGRERTQSAARRDLEVLRAAINYWHRHYGPLPAVPVVILPPKPVPRDRWLTRSEAARLLWAARRTQHLARFILLGLYTGSRSGVILGLTWDQIDIGAGVMYRRAAGKAEDKRKRSPPVSSAVAFWRTYAAGNGLTVPRLDTCATTSASRSTRCTPHGRRQSSGPGSTMP
jgi:integrase